MKAVVVYPVNCLGGTEDNNEQTFRKAWTPNGLMLRYFQFRCIAENINVRKIIFF
jgi:hypothetical protein